MHQNTCDFMHTLVHTRNQTYFHTHTIKHTVRTDNPSLHEQICWTRVDSGKLHHGPKECIQTTDSKFQSLNLICQCVKLWHSQISNGAFGPCFSKKCRWAPELDLWNLQSEWINVITFSRIRSKKTTIFGDNKNEHNFWSLCTQTKGQTWETKVNNKYLTALLISISNTPTAKSDTSSIDHLLMREFVGRPPRYHLVIRGIREQFVVEQRSSGL